MVIQEESQKKLGKAERENKPFIIMIEKGNQAYNYNLNQINNNNLISS